MEITYFQAILTGLIQGITELFPVSSLGHAVLIPAWIGGTWKEFTTNPNSPYLAFTVALHLASAFALFLIFRKRWFGLISGGLNSLRGKSNSHSKIFWRTAINNIYPWTFDEHTRLAALINYSVIGMVMETDVDIYAEWQSNIRSTDYSYG